MKSLNGNKIILQVISFNGDYLEDTGFRSRKPKQKLG